MFQQFVAKMGDNLNVIKTKWNEAMTVEDIPTSPPPQRIRTKKKKGKKQRQQQLRPLTAADIESLPLADPKSTAVVEQEESDDDDQQMMVSTSTANTADQSFSSSFQQIVSKVSDNVKERFSATLANGTTANTQPASQQRRLPSMDDVDDDDVVIDIEAASQEDSEPQSGKISFGEFFAGFGNSNTRSFTNKEPAPKPTKIAIEMPTLSSSNTKTNDSNKSKSNTAKNTKPVHIESSKTVPVAAAANGETAGTSSSALVANKLTSFFTSVKGRIIPGTTAQPQAPAPSQSRGILGTITGVFQRGDTAASNDGEVLSGSICGCTCFQLSRTQRLIAFVGTLIFGVLLLLLSTTFIPTILVSSRVFALCYTLGNLLCLFSTVFIVGPLQQLKTMFNRERAIPSTLFLFSLMITLFGALQARSAVLVLLFIVVQIISLAWYVLTYIPFGQRFASFVLGSFFR